MIVSSRNLFHFTKIIRNIALAVVVIPPTPNRANSQSFLVKLLAYNLRFRQLNLEITHLVTACKLNFELFDPLALQRPLLSLVQLNLQDLEHWFAERLNAERLIGSKNTAVHSLVVWLKLSI